MIGRTRVEEDKKGGYVTSGKVYRSGGVGDTDNSVYNKTAVKRKDLAYFVLPRKRKKTLKKVNNRGRVTQTIFEKGRKRTGRKIKIECKISDMKQGILGEEGR